MRQDVNVHAGVPILMGGIEVYHLEHVILCSPMRILMGSIEVYHVEHIILCSVPNGNTAWLDVTLDKLEVV